MSTIRTTAWTLAATVALGAGSLAAMPAQADAASKCGSATQCSMYYAKHIKTNLGRGSRGGYVADLQHSLSLVGYRVSATGVYDTKTVQAVKKYQYSRKISVTGYTGTSTLHALRVGAGNKRGTTSSVSSASVSSAAQKAVNFAYAQLGKPYVYGASGPSSYDCSGLTSAAWRAAGVSIPRTSYAQMSLNRVSLSSLKPGDLVVYYGGGHVGIYVGNGKIIHAPHTGDVVRVAALRSMPITAAVRPA